MVDSQSSPHNLFRQYSALSPFKQSAQKSDNSFATARSLGTLRAGSSPVKFRLQGSLNKRDRDDYVKLELAPGAAFSSITNLIAIKGGGIRVTSYLQFPGSSPQKVNSSTFAAGRRTQVTNAPFSNTFGVSVQLFVQVRSLKPSKDIFYNSGITFNL
ncbi:MAG TPA: hypothetical protein V6C84_15990 [Coleofasciculaceae cyanobacterium]